MINPITDMNSNQFLAFYLALILTAMIFCWWNSKRADWTAGLALPSVSAHLDPYEIAYLRGGENEVTRVAIVSLTERGFLEVKRASLFLSGTLTLLSVGGSDQQCIAQVDEGPNPQELSSLERVVFEWFATAKDASKVFEGDELPMLVDSRCLHYQEKLQAAHLLTPDEVRERITKMALLAGGVIGAFGVSRLAVGIMRCRPVGFLIVMIIVAGAVLAGIGSASRLSALGNRYLGRMLKDLKPQKDELKWRAQGNKAWDLQSAPDLPLLVGAFGIAVLADTPYSILQEVFKKSSKSSAGGCGAGCGGDGCGGCGGCGG